MKKIVVLVVSITALCLLAGYISHSSANTTNNNPVVAPQPNVTVTLNSQLAAKRTEQFLNNLDAMASR